MARFETSEAYSELEKDVLRFAEQWTLRIAGDPNLMERLAQSLAPDDFVILAAVVGQANFTSRFNVVFDIPLP